MGLCPLWYAPKRNWTWCSNPPIDPRLLNPPPLEQPLEQPPPWRRNPPPLEQPPLEHHESANTGPAPRAKARTLDEARVKKNRRVFVMETPRLL